MNEVTEILKFTVVIPDKVYRIAEKFSSQQPLPEKAEQVYRNTLAVYAGNFFVQYLGFETDLASSHSWNPVMQILMDTADLEVKNIGKLEFRPVVASCPVVSIPPEVWEDRVGYVAVEIDKSQNFATLLGFVETVATEELPIAELRSLVDLIDMLNLAVQPKVAIGGAVGAGLPRPSEVAIGDAVGAGLPRPSEVAIEGAVGAGLPRPYIRTDEMAVHLRQWLQNIFEPEWQAVKTLLGIERRNLAYVPRENQDGISRAKLIDLELQLEGQAVTLLVGVTPQPDDKMEIRVQLHPVGTANYLPANLQLTLLTGSGRIIQAVRSRSQDYCIQLNPFKYRSGRSFRIGVSLGDISIMEEFFAV